MNTNRNSSEFNALANSNFRNIARGIKLVPQRTSVIAKLGYEGKLTDAQDKKVKEEIASNATSVTFGSLHSDKLIANDNGLKFQYRLTVKANSWSDWQYERTLLDKYLALKNLQILTMVDNQAIKYEPWTAEDNTKLITCYIVSSGDMFGPEENRDSDSNR
jgi:hypothetical protein